MAIFALQLSLFTCGFSIHVHAMNADTGHIAEHLHAQDSSHEQAPVEHGCHVHASHTFTVLHADLIGIPSSLDTKSGYILSHNTLKDLLFLIDYPPQFLHS